MTDWWVRQGGSAPIGPVSTELVIRGIDAGKVSNEAEVCQVGGQEWLPIDMVSEFIGYTFDDEAATRVVDSPWFESEAARSMRAPPRQSAHVAPPPPPQRRTAPLGSPQSMHGPNSAPTRVAPPPPPSRAPLSFPRSSSPLAAMPYDESDDAATRVASPMSEVSPHSYAFDDETMTRVATGRSSAAPAAPRAAGPGVLPTLPMRELEDMQEQLRPVTAPRPAAGAPPPPSLPRPGIQEEPSVQVNPALQVPAGSFPAPQRTEEYQAVEPTVADRPQYPAPLPPTEGFPQYPAPPSYANEPDQGLRALVALIVFLAVALAIVLVLLFIRR